MEDEGSVAIRTASSLNPKQQKPRIKKWFVTRYFKYYILQTLDTKDTQEFVKKTLITLPRHLLPFLQYFTRGAVHCATDYLASFYNYLGRVCFYVHETEIVQRHVIQLFL